MPTTPAPVLSVAEICERLVDLQKNRRFAIVEQSRAERSVEAFIARLLGYHAGLDAEQRKAMMALAKRIRLAIEQAGPDWRPPELGSQFPYVAALVLRVRDTRVGWDLLRDGIEIEMRSLARQLPVWAWVDEVRGVADLGLAVIVGECRDLSGYPNPAKVWKRCGLAVINGLRQGRIPPGLTGDAADEAWVERGYNKHRRAQIWVFLDDKMLRAQWRGERVLENGETIAARPIGPYGEVYAERKAWNLARGWTPKHADVDARRIMAKRFLRDLWKAWWQTTAAHMEPSEVSSATNLSDAA